MPRWPAVDWPARSKAWNSSARLAAAPPETSCSAVSAAASTSAGVDAELPVAPGHAPDQPVGGDGQHPFQVFGRQQVQGAAHRPGADDFAAVQGAADIADPGSRHPLADSPEGGLQVLGLHGRHPAHSCRDAAESGPGQPLRGQPQPSQDPPAQPGTRRCCHAPMLGLLAGGSQPPSSRTPYP